MTLRSRLTLLALAAALAPAARANDRAFAYTYESAVLPENAREFEMWSTWRHGRANEFGSYFYSAFDHRMEYEMGLGGDLQTSFYVNFRDSAVERFDAAGTSLGNLHAFEFRGFSNEWKWKLKDASTDKFGLALYGELSLLADEAELETKLIVDKVIGRHKLAYNLVAAVEWETAPGRTESAFELENDFAYAYSFTDRFSAGAEVRNHNERKRGEWEHKALFAGPDVHYTGKNWWVTLAWMTQLPALQRSRNFPASRYVLDEHERTNIRLLWSWAF